MGFSFVLLHSTNCCLKGDSPFTKHIYVKKTPTCRGNEVLFPAPLFPIESPTNTIRITFLAVFACRNV